MKGMKKKSIGWLVCVVVVMGAMLTALPFSALAGDPASLVEDLPTVQAYTDEPVAEEDIQKIVNAGINSPSAMNYQPWHFSVVTDPEVLKEIAEIDMSSGAQAGVADAPLAIVISCTDGSLFDAGLATQAISIEAQLLGYGTKIFAAPTVTMNGEKLPYFRELLGFPEDQTVACVIIIGREDHNPDAVSQASTRFDQKDMVTYITP